MSSDWFPLAAGDTSLRRITLDFGLRAANQHFLELVVPGIGGARYVRQLSWAVGGLAMRDELSSASVGPRATQLANALEALGCKSEWLAGRAGSTRVIGRRAFQRDGAAVGRFRELRDRRHYVQNTFRATVVRALRNAGGLGFAQGTRFDRMTLEPVGAALAVALLDDQKVGTSKARRWVLRWVGGDERLSWPAVRRALSPETATARERAIVRARLVDLDGPGTDKRRTLAAVLEGATSFPGITHVIGAVRRKDARFAREIELACAFGEALDACIAVVVRLSAAVEAAGLLSIDAATRAASTELAQVKARANTYAVRASAIPSVAHTAMGRFASMAGSTPAPALLENLLRREGRVLALLDGKVHKGPLFRNLGVVAADDDDDDHDDDAGDGDEGRTFRLARFHELLRDTRRR